MGTKNTDAIYDARTLGKPKMLVLGFQHMFAMFGATILVPILTGLDSPPRCCSPVSVHCCSTSSPAARSRLSSARPSPSSAATQPSPR